MPGKGTPFDLNTNRSAVETNDDDIALSVMSSPNRVKLYLVDGGASGFWPEWKNLICFLFKVKYY